MLIITKLAPNRHIDLVRGNPASAKCIGASCRRSKYFNKTTAAKIPMHAVPLGSTELRTLLKVSIPKELPLYAPACMFHP